MRSFKDYVEQTNESVWSWVFGSEYDKLPPKFKEYYDSLGEEGQQELQQMVRSINPQTHQRYTLAQALQHYHDTADSREKLRAMWKKVPPERQVSKLIPQKHEFGAMPTPGDWKHYRGVPDRRFMNPDERG